MDMTGCNPKLITDGAFIYKFMSELPGKIGMNKIGNPHLDLYTGPHPEWDGFSATVHIQTSHITFHFFAFGYVFGDVFSCRDFDFESAFEMIKTELQADQHGPEFMEPLTEGQKAAVEFLKENKSEYSVIKRGVNFPPSICD